MRVRFLSLLGEIFLILLCLISLWWACAPLSSRFGEVPVGEDPMLSARYDQIENSYQFEKDTKSTGEISDPRLIEKIFPVRRQRSIPLPLSSPSPAPSPSWSRPAVTEKVHYVGRISLSGERKYVFKHRDTGFLFFIGVGEVWKGWKLLEVRDDGYLFEYGDARYLVRKGVP